MPQSLTELLGKLREATETGRRPFPRDQFYIAAEYAADPLGHLLQHHRHRLVRSHEQQPIHCLREVDNHSLAWLARRPGRNVREKLSGRTHALGVQRNLTADTAENRLLVSFADMIVRRGSERLSHAANYDSGTQDENRVECLSSIVQLCDEGMRRSELANIPALTRLRTNNVMLSDPRYSRVYRAWKWLKQEEDRLDETWGTVLRRIQATLYWLVTARLFAASPRVVLADALSRVTTAHEAGFGIQVVDDRQDKPDWRLNPELDFLILPENATDAPRQIQWSLQKEFLYAHLVLFEGQGIFRERDIIPLTFSLDPLPEHAAQDRGLRVRIGGVDGAKHGAEDFADLKGLNHLSDQIALTLLKRCALKLAPKRRRAESSLVPEEARLGLELESTAVRIHDIGPREMETRGWSVGLILPEGETEWLAGRVGRKLILGAQHQWSWALADTLDPEADTEAGQLSLACQKTIRAIATELRAPFSARVAYAVPDSIDEFSQRSLRVAMGSSFSKAIPVWRSVAAAMAWQQSSAFAKQDVRASDHVIVIDTEYSSVTISLLVARYDKSLEQADPDSNGIYWEHKPPLAPSDELEMLGWQRLLRQYARQLLDSALGEAAGDYSEQQLGPVVSDLLRQGLVSALIEDGSSAFVQLPQGLICRADVLKLAHDKALFENKVKDWLQKLSKAVCAQLRDLPEQGAKTRLLLVGGPCVLEAFNDSGRASGHIKCIIPGKSFGFIVPDEGGNDVFFHYSALRMPQNQEPQAGQDVEFDLVQGTKGPEARNVTALLRPKSWEGYQVYCVPPEGISKGARECLLRADSKSIAWKEWLPDLSLEVLRDGHFGELILLDGDKVVEPFLGKTVQFEVPERLTLARGHAWYSLPLLIGRTGRRPLALEARIESKAFPLHRDVPVKLILSYCYGLESSYELTLEPLTPAPELPPMKARWVYADKNGGSRQPSPVPEFAATYSRKPLRLTGDELRERLEQLRNHTSFESFNPKLANEVTTDLRFALRTDPKLAIAISEADSGEVLLKQAQRSLFNLLNRVPAHARPEDQSERDRIEKMYCKPFCNACETLLFMLQVRDAPYGARLREATASANNLAKAIRQLDARFSSWGIRPRWMGWQEEIPQGLRRMSPVAFTLNRYLSGDIGANLVQLELSLRTD